MRDLLNKMQRVVTTTDTMDITEGDGEAELIAKARLFVLNSAVRDSIESSCQGCS